MNIFKIESEYDKILDSLYSFKNPRLLLFNLSNFFEQLLDTENPPLIESYLSDLFPEYVKRLSIFNVEGIPLLLTESIIKTGKRLETELSPELISNEFKVALKEISKNYDDLKKAIEKNEITSSNLDPAFPVLETEHNNHTAIGGIEYIEVFIKPLVKLNRDKFKLIPSHIKIDDRMEKQIENSWRSAKLKASQYVKNISEYHEVVIEFRNKFGYYEGNSLGISLTIAFLKEILKYYNSRYLILPYKNLSATGSINKDGYTTSLGSQIIKDKTTVVFYSSIQKFIVPRDDLRYAEKQMKELQINYPNRKLSLLGIDTFEDVINRRDLVEIKKENHVVWTYRKIKKNKTALITILLSIVFIGYFLFFQYDKDPVSFEFENSTFLLKNNAGRIIWSKEVYTDPISYMNNPKIKRHYGRIADLNNDGAKEILIMFDKSDTTYGINCYDESGKKLWNFTFRDTISTKIEKFTPYYHIHKIFDLYERNEKTEILVAGQHRFYYPTPIIKINSEGEQVGDIFWHPGGTRGGFLEDIDNDGKIELVASAVSNGFERPVLFSIEYDKLRGTAPTTDNYYFLNKNIADFDFYILLPKSDYNKVKNFRYNPVYPPRISYDKIEVFLDEDYSTLYAAEGYALFFDKDFSNPEVVVLDNFRVLRDSLVINGTLNPPLTDTKKYAQQLIDQIRYWNGETFVTYNEYFDK